MKPTSPSSIWAAWIWVNCPLICLRTPVVAKPPHRRVIVTIASLTSFPQSQFLWAVNSYWPLRPILHPVTSFQCKSWAAATPCSDSRINRCNKSTVNLINWRLESQWWWWWFTRSGQRKNSTRSNVISFSTYLINIVTSGSGRASLDRTSLTGIRWLRDCVLFCLCWLLRFS